MRTAISVISKSVLRAQESSHPAHLQVGWPIRELILQRMQHHANVLEGGLHFLGMISTYRTNFLLNRLVEPVAKLKARRRLRSISVVLSQRRPAAWLRPTIAGAAPHGGGARRETGRIGSPSRLPLQASSYTLRPKIADFDAW